MQETTQDERKKQMAEQQTRTVKNVGRIKDLKMQMHRVVDPLRYGRQRQMRCRL